MKKVWSSTMSREVKISLFLATIKSVLLYGCETWTLTPTMEKSLNGCYTRMLRVVLNVSWEDHITNAVLYGDLPRVENKIAAWQMQLAGHCYRHPELANQPIDTGGVEGRRCRTLRCCGKTQVLSQLASWPHSCGIKLLGKGILGRACVRTMDGWMDETKL